MSTHPLRVAVLCSHRSPGVLHLLRGDRRRPVACDIVCCVTSEETFASQAEVERLGVPCLSHPIARFAVARGVTRSDPVARVAYDRETVALLEPYRPDLVVLDGYLLLLTAPMLEAYDRRIINLHHADLGARHADGSVRYPGLRAVRDAIVAGESQTRASAHLVTPSLDGGPVLLRSWPFPVPDVAVWAREERETDILKSAIWAHQEWMLREAWGPMLAAVIELAALGMTHPGDPIDVALAGGWQLTRDGRFLPDTAMQEVA